MVLVDIKNEEIAALDLVLNEAKVKPIIGFKVINLRYRIENALRATAEKAKPKVKKVKIDDKKKSR